MRFAPNSCTGDPRRRCLTGLAAVALALACAPRLAQADPRATAAAGGGLSALAVSVDTQAGVVRTRACPRADGCIADGSKNALPIPLDRALFPNEVSATAQAIDIGDGRHVVRVRVQAKSQEGSPKDVAWEALFAAGEPAPLFAGLTGFSGGDEGEHTGTALLLRERDGAAKYVLRGAIREDVHICGHTHGTLLGPELLDSKTLKWQRTGLQRLTVEQRDHARQIALVPRQTPAERPLAELLVATGSSGASTGSALTDGDTSTAWSEEADGEGRGEFVVMRAAAEVPIARLTVVLPTASTGGANVASPSTFYLVTDDETFEVSVPASASGVGGAYDVPLPAPLRTSCLSLVLEEAAGAPPHPEVSVRELVAYSELDASGASIDTVAKALGGPQSSAAIAILKRGGPSALTAVEAAWDRLDAPGKAAALDVAIGSPSCEASAGLLLRATADLRKELAHAARQKLLRCGPASSKALIAALQTSEKRRIVAAPILAQVDPEGAIDPLAGVLGDGGTQARAAVRSALGVALGHVDAPRLAALIADSHRTPAVRLELLRAAHKRLGEVPAEAHAAIADLGRDAPMPTRFLLVGPVAALARAGDAPARTRLAAIAKDDAAPEVRVAAVEALSESFEKGAAPGEISLVSSQLASAADDSAPRVREAALVGLATLPAPLSLPPDAVRAGITHLRTEGWSFVRVAALRALARAPRSPEIDAAVVQALTDTSTPVRASAARTLGARRAAGAGDALLAMADDKDEDSEVRAAAASALGDVCNTRALDALTRLARGASGPMANDVQVRTGAAAIEALGKLHPADLRDRLAPALDANAPSGARDLATRAMARPGSCR